MKKLFIFAVVGFIAAVFVPVRPATAEVQTVTVPDAGFDDHVLNNPGDWIYIGDSSYTGAWKSHFPNGAWIDYNYWDGDLPARSGKFKAYAYEPENVDYDYIYQILDETFIEGKTYTLSVWVGQPWAGYANGWWLYFTGEDYTNDLIEASGSAPYSWQQVSLVYTATAADSGKKIGIKMQGDAYVMFEDVTLSYGPPIARNPEPADGALITDTSANLSWSAGVPDVTHDVYFGENFDDVNDGTGDTFRGNETVPYFLAGYGYTSNDPVPTGFAPGTTYYWRIDEVEADGVTKYTGDVWSFSLPPAKAYTPTPADGSKYIDPNADLSWEPGLGAVMQTVYLGDDYDTVANAIEGGTGVGDGTTYDPGPLELETVYYWRVDVDVGTYSQITGDVWSFTTTIPGLGTVVSERWENLDGTDLNTLKNNFKYPNNPDVTEVLTRFSSNLNLDSYGGRIHGWLYVPATGDYTFWLNSDDEGELWLSTNDDSTNIELIAQESSYTGFNTWGTGEEQSDPIELQAGEKYYIMALWKEGGGGDHCQVAWQGPGVPERVVIPGTNLSPYRPLKAFGAKPLNRATDVKQVINLEWKPGIQAASHQVYFGTDEDAVRDATTASSEYIGTRALGDESYNPGKLAWDSTYCWRVDEVNTLNPDGPWVGSVWSFTTADFAIVDNFEDYDAEEQIWWNWVDGLGYVKPDTPPHPGNGSGSEVGDGTTTSFTEETIVHSGGQSIPFKYNNNDPFKLKYSEAKLTLSDNRDWTEQGVKALSLWFQGRPASVGSFTEAPADTYTMTADGADIWGQSDEFHFAFKELNGAGTIIAKVESVENTHGFAKAGVMIRDTLDPNSANVALLITPENGVRFQYRNNAGENSDRLFDDTVTAPHWVKLERSLAGDFTATHSTDGSSWVPVEGSSVQNIPMNSNVYVGLALTSHDATLTCEAAFSSVTITGNVTGQWASQDIGIMSNDAEPLYVAIANNTGQPAVVVHDNPNAAQIDTWTEWNIDLRDFAGINLADVNSIAIGLGNRNNPQVGGSGKMYFDDIALYRPRCVTDKVTLSEADLNSDCIVDFRDLEIMTGDWLANESDLAADLNSDSTIDFKDYAVLADQWLDEQAWPGL